MASAGPEDDYLKRVSLSLRKQLSKPVAKVATNPIYDRAQDTYQVRHHTPPNLASVLLVDRLMHACRPVMPGAPCLGHPLQEGLSQPRPSLLLEPMDHCHPRELRGTNRTPLRPVVDDPLPCSCPPAHNSS